MLEETGEKNAAKEPARSTTFFCLVLYSEKASAIGADSGPASSFISMG